MPSYSHHAYVYEGPLSLLEHLAESACARFGLTREHNPNVTVESWEKFSINDARTLSQRASLRTTGGSALFVLGIGLIASDAQQALLKLFEEPQEGTTFVLLVPHGTLLGTLRSRFLAYPETLSNDERSLDTTEDVHAQEFLSWPYKKRSDWITSFLKDEESVRQRARAFIDELEKELHAQLQKVPSTQKKNLVVGLEDIALFRTYLSDRAPSLKMILEHFAATLPTVK